MNKKIIGILAILVLIGLVVVSFFALDNRKGETTYKMDETGENNNQEEQEKEDNSSENLINERAGKILVVYYSATSNTKNVSEKIAKNLNADLFAIEPEEKYTANDLDWTKSDSRVTKEHENPSLRDIKLVTSKVEDWESYDTILIGYPIWWGIAAWPVDTFVKENDFTGKTVIPFCTSSSSGLGESGKLLEQEAKGGNWLEGHRFNSSATDADIKKWTDSLK